MNVVYKCDKDEVIPSYQYFARAGERIFLCNKKYLHLDRNGSILYSDYNFDVNKIYDNSLWEVSNDFNKAFHCLIKNHNRPFIEHDLNELLNMTTKTPIIIGGCGRSGTTLMLSILGSHSNIFSIPEETHVFYPAPFRFRRLIDYIVKEKKRWCEKTPKNIKNYQQILAFFNNDAKIINMIRDGRDVITSVHPNGQGKYWVTKERWINDNNELFSDKNIINVKFEDVINNPKQTLTNICTHIEEEFEEGMLSYHTLTNVKNNIAWSNNAKPIGKKNSPRWKDKRYKEIINLFMNDKKAVVLMKKFGYIEDES